jgi:hypothetical protein
MFAHSDFAESYGARIRQHYLDEAGQTSDGLERAQIEKEQVANARRLLILQFWRNVGEPRMDFPLAFCDSRTVPKSDVRAFPVNDYAGSGFNFDAVAVIAPEDPERHHWSVFPEMTRDEVVVFRTYDSDMVTDNKPFWTPHSAFSDPAVKVGQPSRYSIEVRATCLFD